MTDDEQQDDGELLSALEGLTPEEALRGFMKVDPEKVKDRIEDQSSDGGDDGE